MFVVESHNICITDLFLTQNFPVYRRVRVRKTDSSVSTVTGLRAGGSLNRSVILDRAGFCVFYRLHADSGRSLWRISKMFAIYVFGLLTVTRIHSVGQQELFRRFDSSRLLCRPVNTRSYRRVTPWTTDLEDEGTAVFRNVRNYLPVPQMFVLWFFYTM